MADAGSGALPARAACLPSAPLLSRSHSVVSSAPVSPSADPRARPLGRGARERLEASAPLGSSFRFAPSRPPAPLLSPHRGVSSSGSSPDSCLSAASQNAGDEQGHFARSAATFRSFSFLAEARAGLSASRSSPLFSLRLSPSLGSSANSKSGTTFLSFGRRRRGLAGAGPPVGGSRATALRLLLLFALLAVAGSVVHPAQAAAASSRGDASAAPAEASAPGAPERRDEGSQEEAFPQAAGVVPAPGVKAKDLPMSGPPLDPLGLPVREKVFRARLYGSMFSYAYYFLDILVGTPPQRSSVILDTGSSLLAFPCVGCSECGVHLDPAMDTSRSMTGEWIDCKEEERCFGTCSGNSMFGALAGLSNSRRCVYTQTYSEGSAIRGIYFSDVVALGEVEQKNPPVRYDFVGCHVQETNLFVTQRAAGIFGISFPKGHRQPTLLDVMFSHSGLVDKKMFSVCISEDGGLLTVGGYEPTLLVAPPAEAPASPADEAFRPVPAPAKREAVAGRQISAEEAGTSPHHASLLTWTNIISHSTYRVPLARMEIEGVVLGDGQETFGNTMVDSGTTYSYFPPSVFARWRSFLSRFCTPELFCERERDGRPCWRVSPGTDLISTFPPIKVSFGDDKNSQVWWWPQGYLYRRTGGYFCDGLDDNRIGASVLGLSFFKNKQVLFDREQDRVGFAAATCPSFFLDQRPPGPGGEEPGLPRAAPFTMAPLPVPVKIRGGVPVTGGKPPSRRPEFTPTQLWILVCLVVVAIVIAMVFILLHTVKSSARGSTVVPQPSPSLPSLRLPLPAESKASAARFVRGLRASALEKASQKVYVQPAQRYRDVGSARPHTAEVYYDADEDRFTGEDGGDFFIDDAELPEGHGEVCEPAPVSFSRDAARRPARADLRDFPLRDEEEEWRSTS
ncbi:aspartyl protease ASP5 [Besnoitia besnoiti]|uniref:Aspartyl protease ASP5 n=1 Tax=Besnoitia besnoiti TaxID=94643 RepID=A0A2A9ML77_BESBE|nr:aspartyl protease ASP5 [Besnoitia besnoiti]PFH36433.1 aspartyl protease ASP5 [Besnoitia besnoiti]